MGELALNLGLLVLTISLTIAGAWVGSWLQQRNWKSQNWQEQRERRISAATQTVQDLARLTDKRLYRQRRLIWAVRRGKVELDTALKEYRDAVFEWMDNLGRIKAELWQSFGKYTAIDFEQSVHDKFASVGQSIENCIRGGRAISLEREERRLNELGYLTYNFTHSLLQRIASENLVGLTGRNVVSYENWDNLSVGFLIRRLFGIAPQR